VGWGFGRNLAIDQRWVVTSFETAQQLGAELLGLAPDVVLCAGSPGVKAMQKATTTVPIVFILVAEPVDKALFRACPILVATSPALRYLEREIGAKWLALLSEIAPRVKQVAYMYSPKAAPYAHFYYESARPPARKDIRQMLAFDLQADKAVLLDMQ
jgi:putative ABC transport system substrate-binding protein